MARQVYPYCYLAPVALDETAQQELAARELAEGAIADAQVVDVRTGEERAAGWIPDSRHIPLEDLMDQAGSLDQERPVVLYCRGGDRSQAAAQAFRASGWQAFSVAGGIVAWAEEGLPLEPEGAEVGTRSQLPPF
jgi:rhodanese-related sulfurtransferase